MCLVSRAYRVGPRGGRKALSPQPSQNLAGDPAYDLVLRALDDAAAPHGANVADEARGLVEQAAYRHFQYSSASMMVRTRTVCCGSDGSSLPCSMSRA